MADSNNSPFVPFRPLIGKRVWVEQFSYDDPDVVCGTLFEVDSRFLALCLEDEEEPSLFINLENIKEVQLCRDDEEPEEVEDEEEGANSVIDLNTWRAGRERKRRNRGGQPPDEPPAA